MSRRFERAGSAKSRLGAERPGGGLSLPGSVEAEVRLLVARLEERGMSLAVAGALAAVRADCALPAQTACRLAEQVLDSDPVLACLLGEVDA